MADQTCGGRVGNVSMQYSALGVGEGHTVERCIFRQTVDSTNSPLNVLGVRSGFTHSPSDGKVRRNGVCAYRCQEGCYVDEWATEPWRHAQHVDGDG